MLETCVIIASGPSLTVEQCEYVRQAKELGKCSVVAVNTSFRLAPFCDILYACDRTWWRVYGDEVPSEAEKYTADEWTAKTRGINRVRVRNNEGLSRKQGEVNCGHNSGYQAINLAYLLGAKKIILIGFDMSFQGGKRHWHDDHPKGMSNCEGVKEWVTHFAKLMEDLQSLNIELVNCSIKSALTMLNHGKLEECL